jgi:hypothetical protein
LTKEKIVQDQTLFLCDVCGFGYLDVETARKCENWCRKTGTCSIEITDKAVYFPDPFKTLRKETNRKSQNNPEI